MYDMTKTRMLLTTAVLAAVAAVFTGGANARALAEDGSGIGAEAAAQAPQPRSRTFSVDEICAALDLEQLRGVLINEPAIKAATPSAIQECSQARADVAPRYLDINRTSTRERVRGPGLTSTPTAVAAVPRRRATSSTDGAAAAPSFRRRGGRQCQKRLWGDRVCKTRKRTRTGCRGFPHPPPNGHYHLEVEASDRRGDQGRLRQPFTITNEL